MKKIFFLFFALFYLVITSKVSASLHLCGGTVTNISLFSQTEEDACECGKKASKSCCDDIEILCKQDSSAYSVVKVLQVNFFQSHFFFLNTPFTNFESIIKISALPNVHFLYSIPPLILLQLNNIILRI